MSLTDEEKEAMREARRLRNKDIERRKAEEKVLRTVKDGRVPQERQDYDLAKEVVEVESLEPMTKIDTPSKPLNVPMSVNGSMAPRKGKRLSISKRLQEVLESPALLVEMTSDYCTVSGLDPEVATVADCVVHNMLHHALKGSPTHLKEIMERIDGKVPNKEEERVSGKMSISEAMGFLGTEG